MERASPSTTKPPTESYDSGVLQRVKPQATNNGAGFLITDQIHGEYLITEPILVSLLKCPPVQRLKGIHQHGITGLLKIGPPVTRLEHCIGAMLLVRRTGGSIEEQAFGLLHDVSHTALSHVVDWALSKPGESYHEVHMQRYIASTTIPAILAAHGLKQPECLDEERFPLVEQPSPHLCADRLDYGLRDTVAFGKLALSDAQKISSSLRAVPDPHTPQRILALTDHSLALILARSYLAMDRDIWSNPSHTDLYRRTGAIIRDVIEKGKMSDASLWQGSDVQFWEALRTAANEEQRASMRDMETRGLPSEVTTLPAAAKVRTIDPDICEAAGAGLVPLSVLCPEYARERQDYVVSRKAIIRK